MAGKKKRPNQTAPTWGGSGRGQGRKEKPPEDKAAIIVSFRLTSSEAQSLGAMFQDGETLHSACKRLALEALSRHEKQASPPQAQSANLSTCRACGKLFDPRRQRCHVCRQTL